MKNANFHRSTNTPSPESEQHFGQRIAAGLDSGTPEMVSLAVYATEADYRRLRPDLRHIPHQAYLRSMSGGVAAAQQRNVPLNLRELRAKPYLAWIACHGLEDNRPHRFLYSCFAPVLQDSDLLGRMGVNPNISADTHQSKPHPISDPATADYVEKLAVRLAVVRRENEHLTVLTLIYTIAGTASSPEIAAAAWALADQIAIGLPRMAVGNAMADSVLMGAEWRRVVVMQN